MKSVLVFLRILIVGCLWGIVFTEGIRVIMLCNWHFDIFWPDHWHQFATAWRAGWFPRAPKEWAFIMLIIVFFPMLITGWWTLCMVAWEEIIWKILKLPYTLYTKYISKSAPTSIAANNRYGVVKRKSYKLIRPAGINTLRVPISDYGSSSTSAPLAPTAGSSYSSPYSAPAASAAPAPAPAKKKTDVAATIDHALFKFDDDDDDDFDLDIDSFEKADLSKKKSNESKAKKRSFDDDDDEEFTRSKRAKPKYDFDDDDDDEDDETEAKFEKPVSSRRESKERESRKSSRKSEDTPKRSTRSQRNTEDEGEGSRRGRTSESRASEATQGPVYDALAQKNYEIISNVTINNTVIDFVGVSENDIYLCLVDKESGDWLADEEMFNGEEPLWFSESSHRVSPVCKLNSVKKQIESALDDGGFEQKIIPCVVIQMANIINADDMFDIWNDMGIEVTRINRGAPKEIKLFSKLLNEADGKVSKRELDNLRKLLKNIK